MCVSMYCVCVYICTCMLTFVIFDWDPGKNKNTDHGYDWDNWGNVSCRRHTT